MNLCICTPNFGTYSETFILNHIKALSPGKSVVITSNAVCEDWVDVPKIIVKQKKIPSTLSCDEEQKIIDFFEMYSVTHILIEYGPSFSEVVELNIRRLHLPLIVHFHGFDASFSLKDDLVVRYYAWLNRYAQCFIAVSSKMKDRLSLHGIHDEKIFLNPYGVKDTGLVVDYTESGSCRFIFVGRFVPKKAPDLLLKAFHLALNECRNIKLSMIGDSIFDPNQTLFNACKDYVGLNKLENSVEFLGFLSHGEVLGEMLKSQVYIQHSITCPITGDAEGMPNSILEAASLGLPVISTFHEGIPEAIENGIGGILVKENDIAGMAMAIVELATNSNLRRQMGENAKKRVLDNYNLDSRLGYLQDIIVGQKFELSNDDIDLALCEFEELDENIKTIKEINALLDMAVDSTTEIVIYGGGYGFGLLQEYINKIKNRQNIKYLIDDRLIDIDGFEVISLDNFQSSIPSNKNIIFLTTALSKKVFEEIKRNLSLSKLDNYTIFPLHKKML